MSAADLATRQRVEIIHEASLAASVILVLSRPDGRRDPIAMVAGDNGRWHAVLRLPSGEHWCQFFCGGAEDRLLSSSQKRLRVEDGHCLYDPT